MSDMGTDTEKIVAALRDLAASSDRRSNTARLRSLFPEIDAAIKAGVRRTDIVSLLAENNLTMTLKSFESAMYRIRARHRERNVPAADPAGGSSQAPNSTIRVTPATPRPRPALESQGAKSFDWSARSEKPAEF